LYEQHTNNCKTKSKCLIQCNEFNSKQNITNITPYVVLFSFKMGDSETSELLFREEKLSLSVVLQQIEESAMKWLTVVEDMRKSPYGKGEQFKDMCKESGENLCKIACSSIAIVCFVVRIIHFK